MMADWRIICGDVTQLPLNGEKFHAALLDPPYELTSKPWAGRKKCVSGILSDVVLPEYDKLKIKLLDDTELPLPTIGISSLNSIDRAVRVEPGVSVPKCPVDLDNGAPAGEPEVQDASVSSLSVPNRELPDELTSEGRQFFGDYILQFANPGNPTFCNGSCRCFRKTGTGLIRMDVTISFPGGLVLLDVLPKDFSDGITDNIRLSDDTRCKPKSPPAVLTNRRTEAGAVLTLDVRGATGELVPTDSTAQQFRLTQFVSPENVGALSGASGLSSEFQPCRIRLVDFATDGTFTLYLHRAILQQLAHKRNLGGFMGKQWDSTGVSFQPETWAALDKLLYPGAFIMAFAGSRTYHRMAVAMEDAGLMIHPAIGWVQGTGFPKSTRIDAQVDKAAGAEREPCGFAPNTRGRLSAIHAESQSLGGGWSGKQSLPVTNLAQAWAGHCYGLQALKPAFEFICVAQKPYEGKPVDSIIGTGAGALNIDGGRVRTNETGKREHDGAIYDGVADGYKRPGASMYQHKTDWMMRPSGRWPANFALCHHPECERIGTKRVKGTGVTHGQNASRGNVYGGGQGLISQPKGDEIRSYADPDGYETVAEWRCHPECAVRKLDEQVGERSPGRGGRRVAGYQNQCVGGKAQNVIDCPGYNDKGGPSRFFYTADWLYERMEMPVLYCPKASRAERDKGLDEMPMLQFQSGCAGDMPMDDQGANRDRFKVQARCHHPTVKPLSLTRWLAMLLLPPPEYAPRRILVPFAGALSEAIGAMLAGWDDIVAIEMDPEYCDIGYKRMEYWYAQPEQLRMEIP